MLKFLGVKLSGELIEAHVVLFGVAPRDKNVTKSIEWLQLCFSLKDWALQERDLAFVLFMNIDKDSKWLIWQFP